MPENTTSTGTMGLLNESLEDVLAGAYGLSDDATRLLETFERLTERLLGDIGPQDAAFWDVMDMRLGLERLGTDAQSVQTDAHIAENYAKDLTELVQAVERLKGA